MSAAGGCVCARLIARPPRARPRCRVLRPVRSPPAVAFETITHVHEPAVQQLARSPSAGPRIHRQFALRVLVLLRSFRTVFKLCTRFGCPSTDLFCFRTNFCQLAIGSGGRQGIGHATTVRKGPRRRWATSADRSRARLGGGDQRRWRPATRSHRGFSAMASLWCSITAGARAPENVRAAEPPRQSTAASAAGHAAAHTSGLPWQAIVPWTMQGSGAAGPPV